MKITIISICCLTLLILFSCNDDPVSSSRKNKTVTSLNGHINNFRTEANIVQTRIYHDSTYSYMGIDTVGADSILNLNLKIPQEFMLKPISEIASGYGNGLSVSNIEAKGTDFLNISMFGEGFIYGALFKRNAPPNTIFIGLADVQYAYADRDVSINGTVTTLFSIFGPPDTTKYIVNIDMAKGWNVITYKFTASRELYREFEVYSGEPEGTEWYFYQF